MTRTHSALAAALLTGCGTTPPAWDGEPAVVVLVLDGVRPEESLGLGPSSATGEQPWDILPRTWDTLVPLGARATTGLNIGITVTTPAHCELLSGRRQPLANYPVLAGVGAYRSELPVLTDSFRAQHGLPGEQVIVTGNTGFIEAAASSLWPGLRDNAPQFSLVTRSGQPHVPVDRDQQVLDALLQQLKEQQPRLAVVNLHSTDRASHNGDEDDYADALADLDRALVKFWSGLQKLPGYADSGYLVLVADHGRHWVSDDAPVWRNHGDDCLGCRQVPVFIAGPGVAAGAVVEEPVLLSDVTATLAALLETDMPGSTGRPIHGLFSSPLDVPSPEGTLEVAAAGGSLAEGRIHDAPWQRGSVWVDGEEVSSPGALIAEGPTMAASGSQQWVCFREMTVDLADTFAPWVPRCLTRTDGGTWSALPPLAERVGTLWRPALSADADGQLVVTWANNPNGNGQFGAVVQRSVYDGAAWSHTELITNVTFPDHPAALPDGLVVAAAADRSSERRHQRQLYDSLGTVRGVPNTMLRMERPDLIRDGSGAAWVAALGMDTDAVHVVTAATEGRWQPELVAVDADVVPYISPRWAVAEDGAPSVLFAALSDDVLQLCAARHGEAARCQPLDADFINEIAVDGAVAHLTLRDASGTWRVVSVDWD